MDIHVSDVLTGLVPSFLFDFFGACNKWQKWQKVSVDIKTFFSLGLHVPAPDRHV